MNSFLLSAARGIFNFTKQLLAGVLIRIAFIVATIIGVFAGAWVAGMVAGLVPYEPVVEEAGRLARALGLNRPGVEELKASRSSEVRFNGGVVAFVTALVLPIARSVFDAMFGKTNVPLRDAAAWALVSCAGVAALVGLADGFVADGVWWPTIASAPVAALLGMGAWYVLEALMNGLGWVNGNSTSKPSDSIESPDIDLDLSP